MKQIAITGVLVSETVLYVERAAQTGSSARIVARTEGLAGSALNLAVALASLGSSPHLLLSAGKDDAEKIARAFPEAVFTFEEVPRSSASTVIVDPLGGTQVYFSSETPPPFARFVPSAVSAFFGFDLPADPEGFTGAVHLAHASGGRVALDAGAAAFEPERLVPLLPDVDVLFLNEAEARALGGDDPEAALHRLPCDEVHVKLGPKGSLARRGSEVCGGAPHRVAAVDTLGAGDAYMAAVLTTLDERLEVSLDRANAAGALAATVRGAGLGLRSALAPLSP